MSVGEVEDSECDDTLGKGSTVKQVSCKRDEDEVPAPGDVVIVKASAR